MGVGSEASSKKLMDLLPKRELHGQNPVVTPCNKQFLSQFEMQSRKSKPFLCAVLEKQKFISKVVWQFFSQHLITSAQFKIAVKYLQSR